MIPGKHFFFQMGKYFELYLKSNYTQDLYENDLLDTQIFKTLEQKIFLEENFPRPLHCLCLRPAVRLCFLNNCVNSITDEYEVIMHSLLLYSHRYSVKVTTSNNGGVEERKSN